MSNIIIQSDLRPIVCDPKPSSCVAISSDIYNLGQILYFVFTNKEYQANQAEFDILPSQLRNIVKSCLKRSSDSRPSIELVLTMLREDISLYPYPSNKLSRYIVESPECQIVIKNDKDFLINMYSFDNKGLFFEGYHYSCYYHNLNPEDEDSYLTMNLCLDESRDDQHFIDECSGRNNPIALMIKSRSQQDGDQRKRMEFLQRGIESCEGRYEILKPYFIIEIYNLNEDLKRDEAENFKYLKTVKDFDNVFPQYLIGKHYFNGVGTKMNIEKAKSYFEKSIRGNFFACFYYLGLYYKEKNQNAKAFDYFLKAADLNHALAQNEVGNFYEEGKYVTKNENKAFSYYKLSAQNGNKFGLIKLGHCYKVGFGTRVNFCKAIECYKKCGHAVGLIGLSQIYRLKDPFVDFEKSLKYLRKAKNEERKEYAKLFRKTIDALNP